eukprot:357643-Chlamydomonas_euryale.AAC.3
MTATPHTDTSTDAQGTTRTTICFSRPLQSNAARVSRILNPAADTLMVFSVAANGAGHVGQGRAGKRGRGGGGEGRSRVTRHTRAAASPRQLVAFSVAAAGGVLYCGCMEEAVG